MEWKPQPTDKHPTIDLFLSKLLGHKGTSHRKQCIQNKICVFCQKEQDLNSFKSELDLKEFHVSGICPTCWDNTTKK
jgi:hypothetical protein